MLLGAQVGKTENCTGSKDKEITGGPGSCGVVKIHSRHLQKIGGENKLVKTIQITF